MSDGRAVVITVDAASAEVTVTSMGPNSPTYITHVGFDRTGYATVVFKRPGKASWGSGLLEYSQAKAVLGLVISCVDAEVFDMHDIEYAKSDIVKYGMSLAFASMAPVRSLQG